MERLCYKAGDCSEMGYLGTDNSFTLVIETEEGTARQHFKPHQISFFGGLFYDALGLVYETELDSEYY